MRSYTIPSIFTAIDRFSAPVQKMATATDRFVAKSAAGMARAERAFRGLISPLTDLNRLMAGLGVYIGLFTVFSILQGAVKRIAEFEQAQVNISVVTGKTIQQNKAMAIQARALSLTYGEAAKSILDMDLALIKLFGDNSEAKVQRMAEAILTTSIALKGVPEEVGKTMGAVLMAFKIPDSQANVKMVGDLLAKAADLSALDWSDLQTMLPIAMQSAAIAWKDLAPMDQFKRLLALFAALRDAQVHVSTGATGVKNLLIDSGIYFGQTSDAYVKMLERISKDPDKMLQVTKKLLGRRTLVSALPLAEAMKMGSIEEFVTLLDKSTGYSERVAGQRMDSIMGKYEQAKRAYDEFIFAHEDGEGPLAASLKRYLDIGKAFLLMNAGSEVARNELAKLDKSIIDAANQWGFWARVIKYVVIALIVAKLAIVAWRIATGAAIVVGALFNIALGVMAAMGWKSVFALRGSAIAMGAYRVAAWLASSATWAWLGPLGLVALALGLIVAEMWDFESAYNNMPDMKDKMPDAKDKYVIPKTAFIPNPTPFGPAVIPVEYDAAFNMSERQHQAHKDSVDRAWMNKSMMPDSVMNQKYNMPTDTAMFNRMMQGLGSLNAPGSDDDYSGIVDNNQLRSEITNSSFERSMQELIIKVQAQQGTSAHVTKKPQGMPVQYSSTNTPWGEK